MTENIINQYKSILKQYWSFDDFREAQMSVLNKIAKGENTLAILPTGGGKSICYQVPALSMNGICIVISPLIALMLDQVKSLSEKNIPAAALFGGFSKAEQIEIMNKAIHGEIKLLYISPERLTSKSFLFHLPKMKVDFIAIDEAHCISQWGHDFRPAYRNINSLRNFFPEARVLAVTATATPKVQADILENLNMQEASSVVYPSRRENLSYKVIKTENKMGVLQSIAMANKESTGIVYARSRKLVVKLSQYLKKRKLKTVSYHAGLSTEIKNKNQEDWNEGKAKIMVATNAFGMGIDKPDVRYVVHFDLAPNLEEYTQEAGRAGRDGKHCEAIILLDDNDIEEKKRDIEKSYPPEHLIKDTYKALASQYNLGIGDFMDRARVFNLIDFCQKYGLPVLPTYYSLKILASMGYIMLTDSFFQASQLQCNKESLDDFTTTEGNEVAKQVLDKVLRIYDGIFYKLVKIEEKYLADTTRTTIDEIKEALHKLKKLGVVEYQESGSNPMLKIRGARRHSDAINISPDIYSKRKADAFSKLSILGEYLNGKECRQIVIDRYFGTEKIKDCLVCDVCLGQNKPESDDHFLENKLIALLKKDLTELDKIMLQFSSQEQKDLVELIERLESNKIISIVSNHIILER